MLEPSTIHSKPEKEEPAACLFQTQVCIHTQKLPPAHHKHARNTQQSTTGLLEDVSVSMKVHHVNPWEIVLTNATRNKTEFVFLNCKPK